MTPPVLGRLERVPNLRDYWANEASDFTPWLASGANIELLSETIGIDLEVQQQEAAVGPFRADILCRDTRTDRLVLVENQLERTDHTHLGQLFTYAAGLDAVTVVWIAQRFTEEHRAALDWLNRITHEDFRFFGIEIELWRIGASAMAPKFNLVAKPNDWSKTVRDVAVTQRGGDPDTQALKMDYWRSFADIVRERAPTIRPPTPRPHYYTTFAIGRNGCLIGAEIGVRDHWAGVSLVLEGPNALARLRDLREDASQIDRELGFSVSWDERQGQARQKVVAAISADPSDRSTWPKLQTWMLETLLAFDRVFRPRIHALGSGSTGDVVLEDEPDRPAG